MLDELRTPHKLNRLLLAPSYQEGEFDSHAVDCPFPFFDRGKYHLTFVGWDGRGYRTGLASSENLLDWKKEGLLLDRGPRGSVTEHNVALTCLLRENDLFGAGKLVRHNGEYVGTYHAYPGVGYETGAAVIGMAFGEDWRKLSLTPPVLRAEDGAEWERGGLYKSFILEHEGRFFMFYNAKNRTEWPWLEQTGVAFSDDLRNWRRYENNPVLRNGPQGAPDDVFASDPCVFRMNNRWVMFYFGLCSDGHARDLVAFSDDLLHWEKSNETLIDIGTSCAIDAQHAHKPGLIAKDGCLYHYYCAVGPIKKFDLGSTPVTESRGITAATSRK